MERYSLDAYNQRLLAAVEHIPLTEIISRIEASTLGLGFFGAILIADQVMTEHGYRWNADNQRYVEKLEASDLLARIDEAMARLDAKWDEETQRYIKASEKSDEAEPQAS